MRFSGKMCLMIILKSHKKPGFQPLFGGYNFQKTTGGGRGVKLTPPLAVLGLRVFYQTLYYEGCCQLLR